MIIAFSSSSPLASTALLTDAGELIAGAKEEAKYNASGVCLRLLSGLLQAHNLTVAECTLFLADLGPGSFTGVKVAVTLAKTMAMAAGKPAGGLSAFDLISPDGVVVLPSKRGEFFVRGLDRDVATANDLPEEPYFGFGPGIEPPTYPLAARFAGQLGRVVRVSAELLVPEYLLAPSISVPNKPYRESHA